MQNPLLQDHLLPPFELIKPEHIVEAVDTISKENIAALVQDLKDIQCPSWSNLLQPIEAREDRLSQVWSTISHINNVMNNEALREAYNKALAIISEYGTYISQYRPLYDAYGSLKKSSAFDQLEPAQQKTVNNAIRDFELSGVALEAEKKQRFADISKRLSELSNQFSNNVLDASEAWTKHVEDKEQLSGLPDNLVDVCAQLAQEKGLTGYLLKLDGPTYMAVMMQADDPELRKVFYQAYMTRASDQGPHDKKYDNSDIMQEILSLRKEKAQLLGFQNAAQLSLAKKMADSTQQVLDFLDELCGKSKTIAQSELQALRRFASQTLGFKTLNVWDIAYCSEKLKQEKFSVSQEALREYFPVDSIVKGLFDVAGKLFGITIKQDNDVETYHQDVTFFNIYKKETHIASFYLDMFARSGKRGGAWMAECRVKRKTGSKTQNPIAYLNCNFSPGSQNHPACSN